MANLSTPSRQDDTQPVRVADLRQVPLAELPGDADCEDLVSRVIGRERYIWRVDVAAFNSAI